MKIADMDDKSLLDFAKERIFSLAFRDLTSVLTYENMSYGLGKMIYALDESDVYTVFGPDATITRNIGRWMSGFGYGGLISWPDKGVFFPEIRPNACGMAIAKLDELPSKRDLIDSVSAVEHSNPIMDGTEIKSDFGKGNHFFEFYKPLGISPDITDTMPEDCSYAILHGSAPERKMDMYGAMDDREWVKTPLGDISLLEGSNGSEYYRKWKAINEFSKKRREFLLKEVLGECEIISNLTHQGIFGKSEVRLGCHDTMDNSYPPGEALFPVALRWDIPLYIFRGKQNLSEEVIGRLDFGKRAEDIGLTDELKKVNILPHGGGYKIDLNYSKIEIIRSDLGNTFVLSDPESISRIEQSDEGTGVHKFGEMIIMNPRELPYDYRGMGVVEKILEYDLADPVAKLQPLMTLKV